MSLLFRRRPVNASEAGGPGTTDELSRGTVFGQSFGASEWFPMEELPALAFDHDRILADALRRYQED